MATIMNKLYFSLNVLGALKLRVVLLSPGPVHMPVGTERGRVDPVDKAGDADADDRFAAAEKAADELFALNDT